MPIDKIQQGDKLNELKKTPYDKEDDTPQTPENEIKNKMVGLFIVNGWNEQSAVEAYDLVSGFIKSELSQAEERGRREEVEDFLRKQRIYLKKVKAIKNLIK